MPKLTALLLTVVLLSSTLHAAEAPAPQLRIPVKFEAPDHGFLSLALYDKNDVLVRSLLYAQPVDKGPQTALWDATTDLGRAVAAGTYHAKGTFFTEPPSLEYLMKVGKSGSPPWRTSDGKGDWGGNLGGPAGICSNSKSIVMAWSCVEDNQITGVQQMDAEGNISLRYFTFYPWDCRSAAVMDEKNLYLAILKDCQELHIAEYKLGEPRGKILVKLPSKMLKTATGRWKGRGFNVVDGLALTPDRIFASVGANNELFIIERASGKILKTIDVPGPRGLAIDKDHLLVVSDKQVFRYTFDGIKEGVAIPPGPMTAPNAICVTPDGLIAVGDSGRFSPDAEDESGTKQIYLYDNAGKLLRKIGAPGGAPRSGQFQPQAIGDITGMCTSPDGKTLLVNDVATGFARTARWSLDGKLEQQWFGRKLETSPDSINPARPNETVKIGEAFDDTLTVQAWEMDFAKRTWKPSWRYTMPFANCWQDDVVIGYGHGGNPLKKEAGHPGTWAIFGYGAAGGLRTFKGRNYMMSNEGAIWTYAPDQAPKLAAMVFTHRCQKEGDKIQTIYDQGPNTWFTWADKNGDAKVQMNEINLVENPPLLSTTMRMATCSLDDQMNIIFLLLGKADPSQPAKLCKLPLKEILPNGAPVYDWHDLQSFDPPIHLPDFTGGDATKKINNVYPASLICSGDSWYCIGEPGSDQQLHLSGIDGDGWWASRNWRKKICRFDAATGACRWAVGRRAPGVAQPGQMYNPISLAGYAAGTVFAADAMAVVWAWDKDGLYLGRLYNGPNDKKQDQNSMYIEMQGANVVTVADKIYLLANDTGVSVHEIHLPKRQPVKGADVILTNDQAAQIQSWDPDGLPPTEKPSCVVQYLPDHRHDAPMNMEKDMDGREGWDGFSDGVKVEPMLVLLDGQRLATVRALYDEHNLYLGYSVTAPNGPINKGSELPACPFVSGAYGDASFAPDAFLPRRTEVREGDVRVIIAKVTGESGKAVDFQQGYWQKKTNGQNGQTITSPAASVRMDQIKEFPGLKMHWHVSDKDKNSNRVNYDLKVAIPLESLGLSNPSGKTIGFDCSIGVANEAGDRRERAGHWSGQSEAAVVDRPGSARLLPETWGTLTFAPKAK